MSDLIDCWSCTAMEVLPSADWGAQNLRESLKVFRDDLHGLLARLVLPLYSRFLGIPREGGK